MLFNPSINLKLVKQIQGFYASNWCLFLLSKLTSSMIATVVSVSRSSKLVKLISDISSKLQRQIQLFDIVQNQPKVIIAELAQAMFSSPASRNAQCLVSIVAPQQAKLIYFVTINNYKAIHAVRLMARIVLRTVHTAAIQFP